MHIEHAALYVNDLEKARTFFETWFEADSNEKYHNPKTGFQSYFLSFSGGARLELMTLPELTNAEKPANRTGFAHIAFSVGSKERVTELAEQLRGAGYEIVSGPRTTGDGYFECAFLDMEGNRLEITV